MKIILLIIIIIIFYIYLKWMDKQDIKIVNKILDEKDE